MWKGFIRPSFIIRLSHCIQFHFLRAMPAELKVQSSNCVVLEILLIFTTLFLIDFIFYYGINMVKDAMLR